LITTEIRDAANTAGPGTFVNMTLDGRQEVNLINNRVTQTLGLPVRSLGDADETLRTLASQSRFQVQGWVVLDWSPEDAQHQHNQSIFLVVPHQRINFDLILGVRDGRSSGLM